MPGRARACQCHRVLAPTWPAPMPGLDGWLGWWWIGAAGRARFFCATELAAATWPFVPAGVGDERVDDFRPDRVGVAGGADPPQPVVGVAFDAASMVSLRHVVPPVQCVHAVGAGAPTVVPGRFVVQVARPSGPGAGRHAACDVTLDQELTQRLWRGVGGAPVVQQPAGNRVGEQPSPGGIGRQPPGNAGRDRPVPLEFGGQLIQSGGGGGGHADGDVRVHSLLGAEPLADTGAVGAATAKMAGIEPAEGQVGNHIEPQLAQALAGVRMLQALAAAYRRALAAASIAV